MWKMRFSCNCLVFFCLIFTAGSGTSAKGEPEPIRRLGLSGVTWSEAVPTPEAVLGYEIGRRHSTPEDILRYFNAVAAVSPRVRVEQHGLTYELRPLIHAVVTSEANLARLEEIRSALHRLSESPGRVLDDELDALPVVVWLGYGVHGNEAAPGEAAMLTLFLLAAGDGEPVDRILEHSIVLLLPTLNPDGRNHFVDWVNANRGRTATDDPDDREHLEPWPGGRTNHYWFDLNRDWLPAQLRETRARLRLYHAWRPQVVADMHEMESTSTFFFQPGVPSQTNPLTPPENRKLTEEMAGFHARYLDRLGRLYFSEESFDDFYYGKGSTYPDIQGAVGMLFEQAGSRGLRRRTEEGVLLYEDTILNPLLTSLSTLDGAVSLRLELLRFHRDFFRQAMTGKLSDNPTAWLFDLEAGGGRGRLLVDVLLQHGIDVNRLAKPVEVDAGRFLPAGSVVVPTRQRQAYLLDALMQRVTDFSDAVFYDISTWTLPLAFGVAPGKWTGDPGELLGEKVSELEPVVGSVTGDPQPYAWLMDASHWRTLEVVTRLQAAGARPRVLFEPVVCRVGDELRRFGAPSVVIPARASAGVDSGLAADVQMIASEVGISFVGVSSGLTPEGPDLGGPSSYSLVAPRIGLVVGEGVSAASAGAAWFVLSERQGLPVSLLNIDRLDRIDLGGYNTLVLPSARSLSFPAGFAERLASWIRDGGLLIAIRDSIRFVTDNGMVNAKVRTSALPTGRPAWKDVATQRRSDYIPGTIFEACLDTTHPLSAGLPENVPVFRQGNLMLEPSTEPGANVALYSERPLLSGYAGREAIKSLAGSAAVLAFKVGRGHVVLFVDDPNFRGFWYGSGTLFTNAVLYGRVF